MFTGIIHGIASIVSIRKNKTLLTYFIKFPKKLLSGLKIGASVSNNGCCLTVKSIHNTIVGFDIIEETLKTTTLGSLECGNSINIERSVKFNDEIGGHLMSGHIFTKIKIYKIFQDANNYQIDFKINNLKLMKYIFYKGFIGIDGISLTINNITKNKFSINLIPETIKNTTLGIKKIGELVNVEIDFQTQSIVNTVEKFLTNNKYFCLNSS